MNSGLLAREERGAAVPPIGPALRFTLTLGLRPRRAKLRPGRSGGTKFQEEITNTGKDSGSDPLIRDNQPGQPHSLETPFTQNT